MISNSVRACIQFLSPFHLHPLPSLYLLHFGAISLSINHKCKSFCISLPLSLINHSIDIAFLVPYPSVKSYCSSAISFSFAMEHLLIFLFSSLYLYMLLCFKFILSSIGSNVSLVSHSCLYCLIFLGNISSTAFTYAFCISTYFSSHSFSFQMQVPHIYSGLLCYIFFHVFF